MLQGKFDYVKVSYSDGTSREGHLVDITDGVGTLAEMSANTAVYLPDVVLEVLVPGEQSVLPNYPFEKEDVIIFRDGQDDLQGRFSRKAEREGGILVFAGGNLLGIFYSHILRVRKPACDFHVPPAYQGTRSTIEVGSVATPVGEEVMDNITWAVNQLRNVERRPVTVESVHSVLFEEGMLCGKSTIKSALAQIGYRL